jgi:hypothetical protein
LYGVAKPRRLRLRALLAARRAVRAFEAEGLEVASAYIATLGQGRVRGPIVDPAVATDFAWRVRVALRLLGCEKRCLPECVGMCAALRAMGCPVEIVIGHVTTHTTAISNVHSWLEFNDDVLTEDVIPGFYFELDRYPRRTQKIALG